jgi:hypothetical protein
LRSPIASRRDAGGEPEETSVAIPIEKRADEPSMLGAVVDVLDAGQRVILDRIELLAVEVRAAGSSALASLAFVLCGLGLLLVGWVAANALAVVLIARVWTHAEGIGIVAAVNLVAGAIALLLARRGSSGAAPARSANHHDAPAASNGGATA